MMKAHVVAHLISRQSGSYGKKDYIIIVIVNKNLQISDNQSTL